jgi:hypothetical protein
MTSGYVIFRTWLQRRIEALRCALNRLNEVYPSRYTTRRKTRREGKTGRQL